MTETELRTAITGSNVIGVENVNHLFVNWPEISNTLTQGLDALWTGKQSAQSAIAATKPAVDAVTANCTQEREMHPFRHFLLLSCGSLSLVGKRRSLPGR